MDGSMCVAAFIVEDSSTFQQVQITNMNLGLDGIENGQTDSPADQCARRVDQLQNDNANLVTSLASRNNSRHERSTESCTDTRPNMISRGHRRYYSEMVEISWNWIELLSSTSVTRFRWIIPSVILLRLGFNISVLWYYYTDLAKSIPYISITNLAMVPFALPLW